MKTYNTRQIFHLNVRGRRQQIQRYNWLNIGNDSTAILEIRPGTGSGYIRQMRLEVPGCSDCDARLGQSLDATIGAGLSIDVIQDIHAIVRYVDQNFTEGFFHAAKKRMCAEKEAMHLDTTTGTEPVIILSLVAKADTLDTVRAEILIESDGFSIQNPRPLARRRA